MLFRFKQAHFTCHLSAFGCAASGIDESKDTKVVTGINTIKVGLISFKA